MRHIDDGALHAYLDGAHDQIGGPRGEEALEAHLAECAACRARLEAEWAVRDRASEILALGAPRATELPPFAALEGRRAPRRWRPVPLAWAATVVLALGAGWIAREVLETPGDDRLTAVTASEPEAERSPAIRSRSGAVPPPEPRPTGAPAPGVLESQDAAAPEAAGYRSGAPAGGTPGTSPDAREGQALAAATDPRTTRDRAEAGAGQAEVAEHRAFAAPTAPPPPAADDASREMELQAAPRGELRLRRDPAAGAAERERERQPAPLGEPAAAARDRQAADAPPPPVMPPPPPQGRERSVSLQEIVVTGAAAASDRVWRPIDLSTAEATLGRPIVSIPGLPLIALEEPATEAGGTIRVRQRLPTGEVLTLEQRRVEAPVVTRDADAAGRVLRAERAAAAAAAPPAPREIEAHEAPDGALVELRYADLLVHARAPLSLNRLRELLAGLR